MLLALPRAVNASPSGGVTARLDRPAFSAPALAADAAYWDASSWVAAHVAAFAFFGACPRRLVPDNLATGVDPPRHLRPQGQRGLRRDGDPLWGAGGPRSAGKAALRVPLGSVTGSR